jgi:hypothetical protein
MARNMTAPVEDEAVTGGQRIEASEPSGRRDDYSDVGRAIRQATVRASEAGIGAHEQRALAAIIAAVSSWSRLVDRTPVYATDETQPGTTLQELGSFTGKNNGRGDLRRALKGLGEKGIAIYEPTRGRGRYSLVGLPREGEPGHYTPITEKGWQTHPFEAGEKRGGRDNEKGVVQAPPPEEDREGTSSAKAENVRHDIRAALEQGFGQMPKARNAQGGWHRAIADLETEGWDGSNFSDLQRVYKRLFRDAAFTPLALAKHYARLRHELVKKESGVAAICPGCGTGGGMHAADCSMLNEPREVATA